MENELRLAPLLTPRGHLTLAESAEAATLDPELARRLRKAFARGAGHGLLQLGASEVGTPLPAELSYWRTLGARYVAGVCARAGADGSELAGAPPPAEELEAAARAVPPMIGAEYLTASVLEALWVELDQAFAEELERSRAPLQDFLKQCSLAWNLVGRVHFNLAENRKSEREPFAFLATYTTQLSAQGRAQHLPLGQALRDYAGAANKDRLLSLLLPVQRAAGACPWLKELIDTGELFHPLYWTPDDAMQLLRDVSELERAGVVVRMPAVWRANRPPRPVVSATIPDSRSLDRGRSRAARANARTVPAGGASRGGGRAELRSSDADGGRRGHRRAG
jgi:non-specific serine/threonine protein kinase